MIISGAGGGIGTRRDGREQALSGMHNQSRRSWRLHRFLPHAAELGLDGGELLERLVEEVDGKHERVRLDVLANGVVEKGITIARV